MKSAILENGETYYTYLDKVFKAIDNEQIRYNWLITERDCYPSDSTFRELFSQEYIWLTGQELTAIIAAERFSFVWGVFSGFKPEIPLNEVLQYDLPYANGYTGFWLDDVGIQHPLADIEIVAWDSSLTLFISKDDELADKFLQAFPLSEDLSAKNTRENRQVAHIEELLLIEAEKRKLPIDERLLRNKYEIWHVLYYRNERTIEDAEILKSIKDILNRI